MNNVFASFGSWYDELYSDKNYCEEADKIHRIIKRYDGSATSLLEFGMGTGKHALELVTKGYKVHGIEISREMLAQVKASEGITFSHGNITDHDERRTFDAIICLFHVLGYITDTQSLDRAFLNAARHLDRDGLFVFDYWHAAAVLSQGVQNRVKRVPIDQGELIRLAEPSMKPERNVVSVQYTLFQCDHEGHPVQRFEETHEMRYFSLPEIESFCERHGFMVETHECFDTGRELSGDSWNAITVARKVA